MPSLAKFDFCANIRPRYQVRVSPGFEQSGQVYSVIPAAFKEAFHFLKIFNKILE